MTERERQIARDAAERHGIEIYYFERQVALERIDGPDPPASIDATARAMARRLRRHRGDWRSALAAHHGGPLAETRAYVAQVVGLPSPAGLPERPATAPNPQVALTFDDGPGPYTEEVLDVLRSHGARATFFVIGCRIRGHEDLLRRMVREGHEIGNHSFSHPRFETATDPGAEISRTSAEIRRAAGFEPRLFRPPYLAYLSDVFELAHRAGLRTVAWTIDPRDWLAQEVKEIHWHVSSSVDDGSVVLLHDGIRMGWQAASALDAILASLTARGYTFPTMSELLERPTPPKQWARYRRLVMPPIESFVNGPPP